jgi:hypothetical protein
MEEVPENSTESSHFVHAKRMNKISGTDIYILV